MNRPEPWLAFVLLLLAWLLKLLIDRRITSALFLEGLLELPVDIAFVAISFLAAFGISSPPNVGWWVVAFVIYLIGAVLVILVWRRSMSFLDRNRYVSMGGLWVTNVVISVTGCVVSTFLLLGVSA